MSWINGLGGREGKGKGAREGDIVGESLNWMVHESGILGYICIPSALALLYIYLVAPS